MQQIAFRLITVFIMCTLATGCEHDGGGGGGGADRSGDFGENDPNVTAATGDSITEGRRVPAGAPYPSRLSGLIGKTVHNFGVSGARASAAVGQVNSAIGRRSGFILIMFGSNDAIKGANPSAVKEQLRAAVQAAKAAKARPILATIPPQTDSHEIFDGLARAISQQVRALASEERVPLVDIEAVFGSGEGLLQADGLHPNDAGTSLIATAFAGVL